MHILTHNMNKRFMKVSRIMFHYLLDSKWPIREGNGSPLQYSCLENPMDGGAGWAALYGVAQSRARLMWLSSSSKLPIYIYIYIYIYIFKSFKIDYSMHFCHSDILYFHVNDNMNGKKGLKLSLVIDPWINLNYTNQLKSRGKTHQNPKHPNCSGTKYWGNIVILVRGSLKSFTVSFHPLCLRTRDNLQRFLN